MSDLRRNESSPWLAKELSRQMAPVAAPAFLWDRIQTRQPGPRRAPVSWILWPLMAGAALLACASAYWDFGVARGLLSDRELAGLVENSRGPDFRSEDPVGIRTWVRARTNIDIDLPVKQTTLKGGPVRLLGARLTRLRGVPVVAIDYRAGDDRATLFVSSQSSALAGNTDASKRLYSWNMRNQTYMIASSGTKDPHGACVLCHANTAGLLMPTIN